MLGREQRVERGSEVGHGCAGWWLLELESCQQTSTSILHIWSVSRPGASMCLDGATAAAQIY